MRSIYLSKHVVSKHVNCLSKTIQKLVTYMRSIYLSKHVVSKHVNCLSKTIQKLVTYTRSIKTCKLFVEDTKLLQQYVHSETVDTDFLMP